MQAVRLHVEAYLQYGCPRPLSRETLNLRRLLIPLDCSPCDDLRFHKHVRDRHKVGPLLKALTRIKREAPSPPRIPSAIRPLVLCKLLLPRLRALALFGRRRPEYEAPLVMPASKKPAQIRKSPVTHVGGRRTNRPLLPRGRDATSPTLRSTPSCSKPRGPGRQFRRSPAITGSPPSILFRWHAALGFNKVKSANLVAVRIAEERSICNAAAAWCCRMSCRFLQAL
jgi:hypothetical protein